MNPNQKLALWNGVLKVIELETSFFEFLQNHGELKVLCIWRPPDQPEAPPDLIQDPLDPKAVAFSLQGAIVRVLNHPDGQFRTGIGMADFEAGASIPLDADFAPMLATLYGDKYTPIDPPHSIAVKVVQAVIEKLVQEGAVSEGNFDYTLPPTPPPAPKPVAAAAPAPVRVVVPVVAAPSAPPASLVPAPPTQPMRLRLSGRTPDAQAEQPAQ